jgi:Mlc titration factor MtfA (ptsG expression regulator)
MASKKFTGRLGLVLTERMKILVSASAIQLTFGLSYFMLRKFHYIYLYPDSYYYKHYKVKFRGHVSDYGSIHLSWNNFEKGYMFPDNGINLGLHELMHALKLHAMEFQVDFTFHENHAIIEKLAALETVRLKFKSVEFLKNRLIHNSDEFLSVCAECFFELPEQFNREIPEVYYYMTQLLNQDPLRADNPVLGIYFQGGLHS